MTSVNQELEPLNATILGDSNVAQFGNPSMVNRGINMKGDAWCCHSPNRDCYHYVNSNGSIYFKNPDRSSYYWDPRGYSRYTTSDGREFINNNPNLEVDLNRFCFSCEQMSTLVPLDRH